MGMADLMIPRKIVFNMDLMLTEKTLIALVMAEGEDGLMFNTRYLSRAMNCTSHKVEVIMSGLVNEGFLRDSQIEAPLGVMVPRYLYIGPETEKILADRSVNAVTTDEYIPTSTFGNLVQDIKEEEITP